MSDERAVRLAKVDRLREAGVNPYPERFERTHTLAEAAGLAEGTSGVRICGRVVRKGVFGKLIFASLQDVGGSMQISLERDIDGPDAESWKERFSLFKRLVDTGDFVGVEGTIYRTQKGELTVAARDFAFLGKTLRPLPEKFHGLENQELRWRYRYLDLVANEDSRRRFLLRSRLVSVLRAFFESRGFLEVETPILCNSPSGALAKPFKSHHNALDLDVYLRIAPETYLKRLIVGGFDRIFEVARCFRNEGMDPSHLQDFTMVEYYAAYWNFEDSMRFTEDLLKHTLEEVLGTLEVTIGGTRVDFGGAWPRLSLRDVIREHAGIDIDEHRTAKALLAAADARGIAVEDRSVGRGSLIDQLYKKTARAKLIRPTFITGHPTELSPLARRNDDDPERVDRFQLVVNTWEIVNAYSELVNPVQQRQALEEQAALNAAGDDEAMMMDEDYLTAMEHGMPPISGWGMGIDRFCALITQAENLRDTVFFPIMRPLDAEGPAAPRAS